MAFENAVEGLAVRVAEHGPSLTTEEGTKTAIVLPFIARVLGYDVFDPTEVQPEFTADLGTKKGEKIDYALYHDGQVQMLVECKRIGDPLDIRHASQLFRYFHTSTARIGILTNGQHWHFFTDLDKPNRMDEKPFLQLNLADIDPHALPEIRKLTKESFDLDSVLLAAEELKYVSAMKRLVTRLFDSPSEELVRLLVSQVYEGPITARVKETFTPLVGKALRQFVNDRVNDRLKSALQGSAPVVPAQLPDGVPPGQDVMEEADLAAARDEVDTTVDEIEGFQIVRAIIASEIAWDRVHARDTKSYFGILIDDNNRKPICRLHFNRRQKYLSLFDENKQETRIPIDGVGDIYGHAAELRQAAKRYVVAEE